MVSNSEGSETLSFEMSHHDVGTPWVQDGSGTPWRHTDSPVDRDAKQCPLFSSQILVFLFPWPTSAIHKVTLHLQSSQPSPLEWVNLNCTCFFVSLSSRVRGKIQLFLRFIQQQTPQTWKMLNWQNQDKWRILRHVQLCFVLFPHRTILSMSSLFFFKK